MLTSTRSHHDKYLQSKPPQPPLSQGRQFGILHRLETIIDESMPYCYLLLGGYVLSWTLNGWLVFGGSLLYFAGAIIWALRSDYRRKDNPAQRQNDNGRWREIYELKPFVYIWLGIVVLSHSTTVSAYPLVWQLCGVLLALAGAVVWFKRLLHRLI